MSFHPRQLQLHHQPFHTPCLLRRDRPTTVLAREAPREVSGDKRSLCRSPQTHAVINRQNNEDLILTLQTAGVSRGRNGFRKDKGGEKLAETEEDLLQHRTDGTDAFDTLYIGRSKFPQNTNFQLNLSVWYRPKTNDTNQCNVCGVESGDTSCSYDLAWRSQLTFGFERKE